ncbi:hypothetical protein O181_022484 [Austropuccinia psidii MF-1]|uniref:Integrase catalytic domain-containing protein n=1 Tax=Austropuccinia psidii MF-1 TaxID=1389203 RepID=A0A9Q3GXQ6_9BASI|nr:hypothetical protein [Austropuccinia psidii MF-1]
MVPFVDDAQGFRYLLTIRDHVSTYSIVYPLKSRADAPEAILDAITQLQVWLGITPKVLRTDNAREFTSTSFANAIAKLGITFCPSLPYLPQENGEAERLNRTLGDMARAMMVQSGMPERFWKFAYSSAAFLHNRLPNSRCLNSSPHQELFGTPPSIATLYPFGADAIIHVPAVNQPHKLAPRGIECKLLKPLMSGGWLLWDPSTNKIIQSASVVFPAFQPPSPSTDPAAKGSLRHIVNNMSLGEVPTERLFAAENQAIDSLTPVKDVRIPDHLGQALSGPHRNKWKLACVAQLDQMAARDVWDAVEKKPDMKIIGHRWVFDLKRNLDSSIERFKARFVARGDRQRPGVDCTETYAPTASLASLRLLLATAAMKNWQVALFDVSGAYLYSPVDETVLVEPPVNFLPGLKGKVLRLKKALYGMRQAGRCWWKFLSAILGRMGFAATEVNQSLYTFRNEDAIVAIWVHVDDGVVISNSPVSLADFKKAICAKLDIKWSDKLRQIVGLECVIGEGEVSITQRHLAAGIPDAYPRPILQRDSPLPALPVVGLAPGEDTLDPTPFRSVIGSLAYLVAGSRPDLAFAVNYLARHSMGPTVSHWELLDYVVGYLLKTSDRGLHLRPGTMLLNLWSDAGWGGDLEHSQTGFMLKLGDAPILWGLKRQSVVALSTCATEYLALSDSTQHLVQAINQLNTLPGNCDNQAAVQFSIDNKSRKRMCYLDRAFFFVNDTIRKHGIKVVWVKTADMQADALTKRLSGPTLLRALPFLGITG